MQKGRQKVRMRYLSPFAGSYAETPFWSFAHAPFKSFVSVRKKYREEGRRKWYHWLWGGTTGAERASITSGDGLAKRRINEECNSYQSWRRIACEWMYLRNQALRKLCLGLNRAVGAVAARQSPRQSPFLLWSLGKINCPPRGSSPKSSKTQPKLVSSDLFGRPSLMAAYFTSVLVFKDIQLLDLLSLAI